jgi:hypothetical protein
MTMPADFEIGETRDCNWSPARVIWRDKDTSAIGRKTLEKSCLLTAITTSTALSAATQTALNLR